MNLDFDAIVVASGSGLTHAGLLAGLRAAGNDAVVHGICVRRDATAQHARITQRLSEVLALAGLPADLAGVGEVHVDDSWLGPGYGRLTEDVRAALDLAARHEALILDPVYTGKTMAGLIAMVRRGDFTPAEKVLFIHTGGAAALFGYEQLNRAITP